MSGSKKKLSSALSASPQNPHKVRLDRERVLEVALGKEVRAFRKHKGMTVKELSQLTGLSVGMLSKIENGTTSPSLTTLQALADALSVPITELFRRFEEKREVVHTQAGEGVETVREGTRAGHQYKLLGHIGSSSNGVLTEPYQITLSSDSDVFPTFQHDGVEFLYVLEGQVRYRHGDQFFHLKPGDTLFFDADAPHGPEEMIEKPVKFLSVISYRNPVSTDPR